MLRMLAALAVLALLAPATAQASRMPAPPNFTIHENADCPAYPDGGSCTYTGTGVIYLAPGADRFDKLHELGHVFDAQVLTDTDRAWFTQRLRFPAGTPWVEESGHDFGQAMPGEQFADAYAACSLGHTPAGARHGKVTVADWVTAYGYHPRVRQHRRICNAIVVLGLMRVQR